MSAPEEGKKTQDSVFLADLHALVREGKRAQLFQALITGGTGLLNHTNEKGETLLHTAVEYKQKKILKLLLFSKQTELNPQDAGTYTPLHVAAERGFHVLCSLLISHGADANACGVVGTPLHAAIKKGNLEIAKYLLEHTDVNLENNEGNTPLQLAVEKGAPELVLLLIPKSDLKHKNRVKDTALHIAAKQVNREDNDVALRILSMLLDAGADTGILGADDKKPIDLVDCNRSPEILELFKTAWDLSVTGPLNRKDTRRFGVSRTDFPETANTLIISPCKGYRAELGTDVFSSFERELVIDSFPDDYRRFFYQSGHYNFVGLIPSTEKPNEKEPTIISVLEKPDREGSSVFHRALVRTKMGNSNIRLFPPSGGSVTDSFLTQIVNLYGTKFCLCEDFHLVEELLTYEDKDPQRTYTFPMGVVYAKQGQKTAEEFWHNEHGSENFDEFLSVLGSKITLKGWNKYAGGLDVKNDTKGTHSVYTQWKNFEIMFHVSTLLPFAPDDPLKLQRSRVIGNDVVNVIFMDGASTYSPSTLTGAVSQVFIVIQPYKKDGRTYYRMGSSSLQHVPPFKPGIAAPGFFEKNALFRDFLLTKLVNGHFSSQKSPGLSKMYSRPRADKLSEIFTKYSQDFEKKTSVKDKPFISLKLPGMTSPRNTPPQHSLSPSPSASHSNDGCESPRGPLKPVKEKTRFSESGDVEITKSKSPNTGRDVSPGKRLTEESAKNRRGALSALVSVSNTSFSPYSSTAASSTSTTLNSSSSAIPVPSLLLPSTSPSVSPSISPSTSPKSSPSSSSSLYSPRQYKLSSPSSSTSTVHSTAVSSSPSASSVPSACSSNESAGRVRLLGQNREWKK